MSSRRHRCGCGHRSTARRRGRHWVELSGEPACGVNKTCRGRPRTAEHGHRLTSRLLISETSSTQVSRSSAIRSASCSPWLADSGMSACSPPKMIAGRLGSVPVALDRTPTSRPSGRPRPMASRRGQLFGQEDPGVGLARSAHAEQCEGVNGGARGQREFGGDVQTRRWGAVSPDEWPPPRSRSPGPGRGGNHLTCPPATPDVTRRLSAVEAR